LAAEPFKKVEIYTDGACSGNPGPGGWAAILKYGDKEKEIVGYDPDTTNNRMELTAVIEALQHLKYPCEVDVYSDSAYIVNCFKQGWLANWKRNGWKTAGKKPVQNVDLWQKLDAFMQKHRVTFNKVEGHAGHEYNERADTLAVEQRELAKQAKRHR
jgi:ribonuclease HI